LHPATGFAHAAIDAALQIGAVDPGTITQVRVAVSPAAAVTLASNRAPRNDEEAWWSIEHAVAVCLAAGEANALSAGLSERKDVRDLCHRVKVTGEGTGWRATVEVTLSDGSVHKASVEEPRGHAARPASDDELCDKWRRLCGRDGSHFLERLLRGDAEAPFSIVLDEELAAYPQVARLLR